MNLNTVFGTKIGQTQGFLQSGKRVPLSCIHVPQNIIAQVKSEEKDGYKALQIAFGTKNKISKSAQGHIKKAGKEIKPRFFREVRTEDTAEAQTGADVNLAEVLKPGDIISVTGTSKGKGFAGVVKRHGFAGGPRTHGQSDRERAPGSIGQSTTPGRVFKGKKMAGRMGDAQVTVKNLVVIDINGDKVFVKGLVPGTRGSVIKIVKIGEAKNFIPLFKAEEEKQEEPSKNSEKEDGDKDSNNASTQASSEKSATGSEENTSVEKKEDNKENEDKEEVSKNDKVEKEEKKGA